MTKYILYLAIINLCLSCDNRTNLQSNDSTITNISLQQLDSANLIEQQPIIDIKPIWGYRFQIKGDFDADGKQDIFNEHFYSNRDHKETNKYFSGITDMWVLYDSAFTRDCHSFLLSNNPKFDTIPIGGILGPLWLKNEGDLDNDGGDDISFVNSLAQESSINHCHILSFKKGKWMKIYSFEVREWQFPPLPQAGKTYGLFGMEGSYNIDDNDTINATLQKQFDEFPGFITKIKSGKVKIKTFTSEAIDTTLILNLSKHPKIYN